MMADETNQTEAPAEAPVEAAPAPADDRGPRRERGARGGRGGGDRNRGGRGRDGRTLHHDGLGHFGAGRVYVRSAPAGTGIIAGGPMRAVFESLGVADVVTKSIGTSNPYNMIRATFEALKEQTSPKSVAQRRG